MQNNNDNNYIINKLIHVDDKFMEIESIIKIINIWVKERDYELIPVVNILNDKVNELIRILRK